MKTILLRTLALIALSFSSALAQTVIVESRTAASGVTADPPYAETATTWSSSGTRSSALGLTAGITGSRFGSAAGAAFRVTPTLVSGATYAVEVTFQAASASSDLTVGIATTGTSASTLPASTTLWRSANGNTWILLGTITTSTTTPTITFTQSGGTISSTSRFYADAVRFVQLNTAGLRTWNGGGANDFWNNSANWVGGISPAPSGGDSVAFDGATRLTPSMDGPFSVNSVTFNAGASAFTVGGGGGALTVATSSGIVNNSALDQVINPAIAQGANTLFVNTGSRIITLGGIVSGSAGYSVSGSGTLFLGNAGNTITGPVSVGSGATLELTSSSRIGGTSAGAGDITLNGGTFKNDDLTAGNALVTANRGIIVGASGGSINTPSTAVQIYTGVISGSGNTLSKIGPGELRVHTGHNTFGKLLVGAGMFTGGTSTSLAFDDSFGAVPSVVTDDAITLASGTQLRLAGGADVTFSANRGITMTGPAVIRGVSGRTLTIPSAIKGGQALTIGSTVSGEAAVIVLSSPNNAFGDLSVVAGTLQSGAANVIPDTSKLTMTGGTFNMNGFSETIGDLILNGGTVSGAGSVLTSTLYDLRAGTISAGITGNLGVTKTTSGTVILSGTNSFTGKTTVSGGLLTLNIPNGTDGSLGTPPLALVADQFIFDGGALSVGSAAPGETWSANRGITITANGGQFQGSSGDLNVPGNIVGPGAFIKTNSANLTLSGQNSFAGNFTIYGGGVRFNGDDTAGHGTVIVGPTTAIVTLRNIAPTLTSSLTNNIVLNGGGTSDIDVTCDNLNTFTLSGQISGNTYLTRGRATGAQGNVVISGDNSFSGGVYWGRGVLTLGHKNALGTGALTSTNLVVGSSNVLQSAMALTGVNAVANTVNLSGLLIAGGANDLELNGPLNLVGAAETITNRSSGQFVVTGVIGGTGSLTLSGPSQTIFAGLAVNTYSGGTTINGSLDVMQDGALGTGNVTVNSGGSLKLEGGSPAHGYMASSATLALNGTATVALAFTGSPTMITGLTIDGAAKAPGTWGGVGSGAQHEDAHFTGTGMLNVTSGPSTITAVTSSTSGSSAVYGTPITFTATVTGSGSSASPSGTVTFLDHGSPIATVPLVASGAGVATGTLTITGAEMDVAGSSHFVRAQYQGDNTYAGSIAGGINQPITAATLTAVVGVANKVYDGTSVAGITSRGFVSGVVVGSDDVNLATSGSALFSDKNVGTGKSVSVTGLALSGTTAGNYVLASDSVTVSADITAKALSVTGLSANKTYDATTTATLTGSSALTGQISGDDVTLSGTAAGSFPDKNVGAGKVINLTGLSISGADAGNYSFAPTLSANITAASLTVTGVTAMDKPFDGNTNATLVTSNAVLNGVISPDVVSLVTSNAAGYFADPDIGDNKPVSITGLLLAGADAGNYQVDPPPIIASIKHDLTVTGIGGIDKTYDGTRAAGIDLTGATLNGVESGDDVVLNTNGATGLFVSKGAGANRVIVIGGLTLDGQNASKYLIVTPVTTTANISPAPLTVTGLTAQSRAYNAATVATVTGTPVLNGVIGTDDASLSGSATGSFADKNVGTTKLVATAGLSIIGGDAGNYLLTQPTLSADITPAGLTVADLTALSRVYNATTVATIGGTPALSGQFSGDDVSLTGSATGQFADKNVGISKVVSVSGLGLSGSDAGNYLLTQPTLSANITPANLFVDDLTAQSKAYDGTTVAAILGTPTLVGVIGVDSVSLTGTVSGQFADKNVGTAKLVATTGLSIIGADAGNYVLTQPTLLASITAAGLTVSGLSAQNKIYDGTTVAGITGTPVLNGVIGSEDVTLNGTAVGTFNNKNADLLAKPVAITGLSITGTDAGNYALTQPTLSARITPAPLIISGLAAQNKIYDSTTAATVTGTAALSGQISGDDVTLNGAAVGAFADKNVGVGKSVSVSGFSLSGADAGNYQLAQPLQFADITVAGLGVSGLAAQDKIYDGTTAATIAGSSALTGVFSGDDVTLTGTAVGTFNNKNAELLPKPVSVSGLSISGGDAGNYLLAQPALSAKITPATLSVTGLTAQGKVYDSTTAATVTGTAALSGVVSGDDVTLAGTGVGAFINKNVGVNKAVSVTGFSLTGADAGNYQLAGTVLTASITAAGLTVNGLTTQDKVYDAGIICNLLGFPVLSGVISGDDVSLSWAGMGSFANKNVGVSKPVTVNGLSIIGADSGNYLLTPPPLTASITPAALYIDGLSAQSRAYDGTTVATITGTPVWLSGPIGTDSVSLTGTASGQFADKNVGTAKPVTVTGLGITGADAPNYNLFPPSLSADITPLTTTNNLVSSDNPSFTGSNVTFTATLDGAPVAADKPTGEVVFLANGVPFSTNALVSGVASASTTTLAQGTNAIVAQYAGDGNFSASTSATLQQVVENAVTCSATNELLSINANVDGTFTLSFRGTPQAQYYVVSSSDISAPMTGWSVIAGSTNTVTDPGGLWSITVTNNGPQLFYRSAAVVPCQ